jgi:hypothetical protein
MGGGRGWAAQAFPEGVIHYVAHGLVPLGRAEFRLPKKIVVYYEGGSHTYDHIYAKWLSSSLGEFVPRPRRALPRISSRMTREAMVSAIRSRARKSRRRG